MPGRAASPSPSQPRHHTHFDSFARTSSGSIFPLGYKLGSWFNKRHTSNPDVYSVDSDDVYTRAELNEQHIEDKEERKQDRRRLRFLGRRDPSKWFNEIIPYKLVNASEFEKDEIIERLKESNEWNIKKGPNDNFILCLPNICVIVTAAILAYIISQIGGGNKKNKTRRNKKKRRHTKRFSENKI